MKNLGLPRTKIIRCIVNADFLIMLRRFPHNLVLHRHENLQSSENCKEVDKVIEIYPDKAEERIP